MRADLGLDEAQLGNIFSAFTLGYAICQFPAGILADRFGPRRVLSAALVCWGACNVLTALAQPLGQLSLGVFSTLLSIRFLLGVTQAPTYPAAARSLLHWVPATRRALANAIVIAGIGIGSAVAPSSMGNWPSAWIGRGAHHRSDPGLRPGGSPILCGRDDPIEVSVAPMPSPLDEPSSKGADA